MSQHTKAPLGIKEPKVQKNPYGISASENYDTIRSKSVPPYHLPQFCIGSSGAVNAISNQK